MGFDEDLELPYTRTMKYLGRFAFVVGLCFLSSGLGLSATNSNSSSAVRLELFWGALPLINTVNIKGSEQGLTFNYFSASKKKEQKIVPTKEAWEKFWKALDELKVWEWEKRYDNRNVRDGLVWSLKIQHGDRSVSSGGTNGYPGSDLHEMAGPMPSQRFKEYQEAVEALISRPLWKEASSQH